jgi:thermitase
MKPHVLVKLKADAPLLQVPAWTRIIREKSAASTRLHPSIDALLARRNLPVWVAREYSPGNAVWSKEEIASGLNRIYRLVLQRDAKIPPSLTEQVALLPVVEYARLGALGESRLPNARVSAMSARAGQEARDAIRLREAQMFTRGDDSVTVAVLDTGVQTDHPELRAAMLPGHDFVDILDGAEDFIGDTIGADSAPDDEVGHGTHVAGIIAAAGTAMPEGVVPRCRILPVRVLAAMARGEKRVGAGLIDNINSGVKWAVDQGADVINMSLGIRHGGGGLPHEEVIEYARRKGVTVVAASGNDGKKELYYPGALPHVIAVGACDENGEVAAFSTWGPQVSLIAPGENIFSSYLENGYAFSSGTSQAAPFVTGAVAMLKSFARSRGHQLSDDHLKQILKHTCDRPARRFRDRKYGFGRLNLVDAMRLLEHRLAALQRKHHKEELDV